MEYARPVVLELSTHARYIGTFRTTLQQAANGLQDLEQLRLTVRFQDESIDTDLAGTSRADGPFSADV